MIADILMVDVSVRIEATVQLARTSFYIWKAGLCISRVDPHQWQKQWKNRNIVVWKNGEGVCREIPLKENL